MQPPSGKQTTTPKRHVAPAVDSASCRAIRIALQQAIPAAGIVSPRGRGDAATPVASQPTAARRATTPHRELPTRATADAIGRAPRTVSELAVTLDVENRELKAELYRRRAAMAGHETLLMNALLCIVEAEIGTRGRIMSLERLCREAVFNAIVHASHSVSRMKVQCESDLRRVMDDSKTRFEEQEQRHASELREALWRPHSKVATTMTDLTLTWVPTAGQHREDQQGVDGADAVMSAVIDETKRRGGAPVSIGVRATPSQVPGLLRDAACDSCDIRLSCVNAACETGSNARLSISATTQTEGWRRIEQLDWTCRMRIEAMQTAFDVVTLAKEVLLLDLSATKVRSKCDRGTLCVSRDQLAGATGGGFAAVPMGTDASWHDAGAAADNQVSSILSHHKRVAPPLRQSLLSATTRNTQQDVQDLVCWAWSDADAVVFDTDAHLPGQYLNPARQLDATRDALGAAQAAVRRLTFESARSSAAARKSASIADAASDARAALATSVEPLALRDACQREVLLAARQILTKVSNRGRQGQLRKASPSPPKGRTGGPAPPVAVCPPSLELLAEISSPSPRHQTVRSDSVASGVDITSECLDATPSPKRRVHDNALAVAAATFESAARSLIDRAADHQSVALSRTSESAGAASMLREYVAFCRELVSHVVPEVLAVARRLHDAMGDVERHYGGASPRRTARASAEGENLSRRYALTRMPAIELSRAAVEEVYHVLDSVERLRTWLTSQAINRVAVDNNPAMTSTR